MVSGPGSGLFIVTPPDTATVVATLPASAAAVEFAYEAGTPMLDDFEAPNRRIGLGYDPDQTAGPSVVIEADGRTLFEAAVVWVTGG